jgi:predicted acetyltransferase
MTTRRTDRGRGHEKVVVREARRADFPRMVENFTQAFRIPGFDTSRSVAYFNDNAHLDPSDSLVAEVGGVLGAQVAGLRLTVTLAGRDVPVRGIAGVATAPEMRQRGLVATLLRATLERMRKRGEALSMLYPFREAFYAKHGWARVEWAEVVETAPEFLPRADERTRVRRLDKEADAAAIAGAYDAWRRGKTGPLARSAWWWRVRVLPRVAHGVVFAEPRSTEITGYLLYDTAGQPNSIANELFVREHVATTPAAHRGLLGFLASLVDQYTRITISGPQGTAALVSAGDCAPRNDAVYGLLHGRGALGSGVMGRIVDLEKALALHPSVARAQGALGLDLTDPVLATLNQSFDVTLSPSGPRAVRGRRARARLAMSVGTLSQIYFGGASARAALEVGRIRGSGEAAALLDEAVRGPAPFLSPMNAF